MLRTFNCGIGLVLLAAPGSAPAIEARLTELGETVYHIGRVVPAAEGGPRVRYQPS